MPSVGLGRKHLEDRTHECGQVIGLAAADKMPVYHYFSIGKGSARVDQIVLNSRRAGHFYAAVYAG